MRGAEALFLDQIYFQKTAESEQEDYTIFKLKSKLCAEWVKAPTEM